MNPLLVISHHFEAARPIIRWRQLFTQQTHGLVSCSYQLGAKVWVLIDRTLIVVLYALLINCGLVDGCDVARNIVDNWYLRLVWRFIGHFIWFTARLPANLVWIWWRFRHHWRLRYAFIWLFFLITAKFGSINFIGFSKWGLNVKFIVICSYLDEVLEFS